MYSQLTASNGLVIGNGSAYTATISPNGSAAFTNINSSATVYATTFVASENGSYAVGGSGGSSISISVPNAVVYNNSSNVVTGSSNFTFDGSNLVVPSTVMRPNQAWVTPAFQNNWTNFAVGGFSSCGYIVDSLGWVQIRGLVSSGTVGAPIFTLPAYASPLVNKLFVVGCSSQAYAEVRIYGTGPGAGPAAAGSVILQTGQNGWVSLDGIRFQVGSN